MVSKLLLPWILKYIKIYFLFSCCECMSQWHNRIQQLTVFLSKQAIGEAMLFEASKKSSLLISTCVFVECIQSFSKENELLPIRLELIYCFIAGMRPSLFRIFTWKMENSVTASTLSEINNLSLEERSEVDSLFRSYKRLYLLKLLIPNPTVVFLCEEKMALIVSRVADIIEASE